MTKKLLFLLALILSTLPASAYDYSATYNGKTIYYSENSDGNSVYVTYKDLQYNSYSGEIIIPGTVIFYSYGYQYSVTKIGTEAFRNCNRLTSVSIPNTVTSIGYAAFKECSGLTSVSLGNSVTSIGESAFNKCSSLTSVSLGNSVTSIGDYAFNGCSSLTSVTIPNSVSSFGDIVFCQCPRLEKIFGKNTSNDNRCLIVDGILNSFAPHGLTEYTIPNTVTSICHHAFSECNGLKMITIPNTVTSIGRYGFINCTGLSSITIENEDPANITLDSNVFYNVPVSTCTLYVPKGSVSRYKSANQWKDFGNIVEMPEKISVLHISLNEMNVEINEGESVQLYATVTPEDATDGSITWSSQDEDVATVDETGLVTAVGEGETDIVATANDGSGVTATCHVTVTTPENIIFTLTDGDVYAESENKICDVKYVRNFSNNTVWQCLYVPFDMSYDEWAGKAQVAELNSFREHYDENGEMVSLSVEYRTVKSGSLVPNVPYLIKPNEIGPMTIECSNKHLAAAPEEEGSIDASTTRYKYTLKGTYTGKAEGELKSMGAYVVGKNGFGKASSAALSPQRFYLVIESRDGGYWGNGGQLRMPERIDVYVDGEETGICEVLTTEGDGFYYDLQGRRVAAPEHGIFIHNGKKIIMK